MKANGYGFPAKCLPPACTYATPLKALTDILLSAASALGKLDINDMDAATSSRLDMWMDLSHSKPNRPRVDEHETLGLETIRYSISMQKA